MADNTEVSLHFSDYWRVIKNRWPIVVTVFILVVATTYFYTRSLPKIYFSSAVIRVERENRDVQIFKSESDGFDPVFFSTEFEMIQSKKVLYPVIEKMELRDEFGKRFGVPQLDRDQAYFMLRNYLKVQPYRNTKLIEIGVEAEDPDEAAKLANAITQQYLEYRIQDVTEKSTKGLQTFRDELEKQKKVVEEASAKVERIRKDNNLDIVGNGPDPSTQQEQELQRKEGMLTELKADVLARRVRYDKVKNMSIEEMETVLQSIGLDDPTRLDPATGGTNKQLNYFVGAGVNFTDQDIKSLFGLATLAKP